MNFDAIHISNAKIKISFDEKLINIYETVVYLIY